MSVESNPLDSPTSEERILLLVQRGVLDVPALNRALQISGDSPDRTRWARFLDVLLLVLGAGSLISGIFFFFAFNWASMHHFAKLGILELAVLASVGIVHWRGLDRTSGKIALATAGLLAGALLALYGQIYQTGADSYQLFLVWALVIIGWVWISKFTPLWFVWFVLLNITLGTYWFQVVGRVNNRLYLLVFALNGVAVLAWELARHASVDWLKSHWPPRIFILPVFIALGIPTLLTISGYASLFGGSSGSIRFVMVLLYIGVSALTAYTYSQIRLDLFMLIVCSFSWMITLNTFVFRFLDIGIGTLLLLSALFILEATITIILLRRISTGWEKRAI